VARRFNITVTPTEVGGGTPLLDDSGKRLRLGSVKARRVRVNAEKTKVFQSFSCGRGEEPEILNPEGKAPIAIYTWKKLPRKRGGGLFFLNYTLKLTNLRYPIFWFSLI